MNNSVDFSFNLSIKKEYDVIVAGGGVAGIAAALSASKYGKSVLLIEKSNILGGLATLGLVNYFVPMCNGDGKQIIFGLADKWFNDSIKYGYDSFDHEWNNKNGRLATTYSPYIFAFQLLEEIKKNGIDLLYDCIATYPKMDNNYCKGLIVDSKSGLEYYSCKILIDTTGDGDLMRRANIPVAIGENYYSYFGKMISLANCKNAINSNNVRLVYSTISGGNINLYGDKQPYDKPKWNGITVEDVTDYLVTNQLEMLNKIKSTSSEKNSRDLAMIPLMPNLRTTCHIVGDKSLKITDCYKHDEESIGAINDFDHKYHLFEISYRSLTNHNYPNIITAGRSVDGTGYGWDLLRVIPPAIITGQAAGFASSISIDSDKALSDIDIKILQKTLENDNVMIHFPDEYVPEDKSVIIHGKNYTNSELY